MKELIHQEAGNYIFWKIDDNYSLLLLLNKKRKKEKEHPLTAVEKEKYFSDGMAYIRILVEKYGK